MREELAGRLRQLRELTGRSLRELARDIHVSSSSLSRYFSGQAVPPWPTVVALCRAAGRDPRPLREVWERAKDGPQTDTVATATVRNDLPHDITAFTGRRAELDVLLRAARNTSVVAIDGMGGVGKSALAVHAAHLLIADFPGGQLYLDLHGFTPGRERVEPAEALRVLLAVLGLPPGRIPDGVAERAALWRSELATRRAIVLLDNAADAEHVRDLLPGAGQSFVVITSRRRMVELDGVQPISLDVLPIQEAAELFVESAGGARPGDVGEVLRRCGNLPLAIRVAAARLRHRPAWTLDTLVERLREGGPVVSDVFEMSLRQLDPAQRRMFGLLGLVPGEDIDAYGAAALAGIPLANARALLEDLVDAHLVQEPAAGRYRMHDLLRQVARADDAALDPVPAITRLADYYLSGMLAVKKLVEILIPLPVIVSQPPPALPDLSGYDKVVDWMETEWVNLTTAFSLAVELRIDAPAVGLAQLATISEARRGGTAQLRRGLELSMPAAERLGDRRVLASHRYLLGAVLLRVGRLADAVPELEAARVLMAAEGDVISEALTLLQLADIRLYTADAEGAVELLHQATVLLSPREAAVLVRVRTGLGLALVQLGKYDDARQVVTEVIETARGLDRQTERWCLEVLGRAALGLGDARTALDLAEQTVALNRVTRHPILEAASLTDAAVALRHLGRTEEAAARHAEAVHILERAGEPHRVVLSLLPYAEACLVTGDRDAAARHFQAALDIGTAHGIDYVVSAARTRLARAS
ncbi:ATP-binding protein [Plantactinospora soyae]|uniref:Tetratricopeptide (TPR) repeat protein/transcriptional regulator with XRE-family HTH domain n=1 Tax=Plantactinospora soyae TaxID=1544732 RepID=A0A927M5E1_9ACTN|nr:XRE family transcriptional regulator [Plantactinospora soyae]MBE1488304.1 tetratricopeptide (TPR) repeat protein/transcriptional regulator with XRE-family HTH domain [Plantactinospora soyae]